MSLQHDPYNDRGDDLPFDDHHDHHDQYDQYERPLTMTQLQLQMLIELKRISAKLDLLIGKL